MSKLSTDQPLEILNASAGSGKTYHLVRQYIELLIADDVSPSNFKHLLAMTFTNKAALEMKERIVQALNGISTHDISYDTLKVALSQELNVASENIVSRCQKVLETILHQYEDFHVMTIDKFNLRLIKSFSRDLDLPGEFEVVLDESELIETVVDDLLNQLGDPSKGVLNDLMIQYAKSNVDEEKTWDFRRNLIEFGSILKNERHRPGIAKLLEMSLDVELYRTLQAEQRKVDAKFVRLAQEVAEEAALLDSKQIHGGGHTINDIGSIVKNEYFPVQEELIKKRLSGNLEKSDGVKDIPVSLKQRLETLNQFWTEQIQNYAGTYLFLKNFFNMALLQYMANALEHAKKEGQLIRISEFNNLISELIQDENAPFIYERLGTRYHHFLLDEFQDTSHLQWLNLVPLIYESISQRHENLIVGDPKQSIYRFKNGIAEQFVALPAIYNPENDPKIAQTSAYFESMGVTETLDNNWRSSPTIVEFNNTFFETFRSQLPEETATFYNSVHQHPKSSRNGLVEINSQEGKETQEETIQYLINTIENCLKEGFSASEICILGRRNRECNGWAIALDQAGYRVVSADSLLIDSSPEVQLAINYLKWRLKPTGESEKKQFAEMYLRQRHESYDVYKKYLKEGETKEGKRYRYFDDSLFIRDHFESVERFFFKYEHLYDLVQGFFEISKLKELENPYLHHLADLAHEFGLKRGPSLQLFLEEYERKKKSIAVQIPAAKDAINIMTIHKSKGLEFPVVILPSFNIKMDLKSSFLIDWNDFLLYKQPSKNDLLEPLVALYEHEKNQILTDIVNLCYVGMTRPIDRLYIRNIFDKGTFGATFHEVLRGTELAEEDDGTLSILISDGERTPPKEKEYAKTFSPEDITDKLWFPHIAFQDKDELDQTDFLSDEMQYGIAFHLIVSRVNNADEISSSIADAIAAGEVRSENKEALEKSVNLLWSNEDYRNLIDNASEILSEQTILLPKGEVIRADKIALSKDLTSVIDFKTGIPSPKDTKQVLHYSKILEEMGYPNVHSYLHYSTANKLVQVS